MGLLFLLVRTNVLVISNLRQFVKSSYVVRRLIAAEHLLDAHYFDEEVDVSLVTSRQNSNQN